MCLALLMEYYFHHLYHYTFAEVQYGASKRLPSRVDTQLSGFSCRIQQAEVIHAYNSSSSEISDYGMESARIGNDEGATSSVDNKSRYCNPSLD